MSLSCIIFKLRQRFLQYSSPLNIALMLRFLITDWRAQCTDTTHSPAGTRLTIISSRVTQKGCKDKSAPSSVPVCRWWWCRNDGVLYVTRTANTKRRSIRWQRRSVPGRKCHAIRPTNERLGTPRMTVRGKSLSGVYVCIPFRTELKDGPLDENTEEKSYDREGDMDKYCR